MGYFYFFEQDWLVHVQVNFGNAIWVLHKLQKFWSAYSNVRWKYIRTNCRSSIKKLQVFWESYIALEAGSSACVFVTFSFNYFIEFSNSLHWLCSKASYCGYQRSNNCFFIIVYHRFTTSYLQVVREVLGVEEALRGRLARRGLRIWVSNLVAPSSGLDHSKEIMRLRPRSKRKKKDLERKKNQNNLQENRRKKTKIKVASQQPAALPNRRLQVRLSYCFDRLLLFRMKV